MTRPRLRRLIWALGLCAASLAHASGGDGFAESSFQPEWQVPAAVLPAFAGGQIGVLPGSHWRVFHFMAWRAATDHALSPAEVQALGLDQWRVNFLQPSDAALTNPSDALQAWQTARDAGAAALPAEARPAAPTGRLGVSRGTADWSSFLNCPADAFLRATQTLAERQRLADWPRWGGRWIAQQDQVFANCSPPESQAGKATAPPPLLPAALPGEAPAWLMRDHAYQQAAAYFYATRFTEARAGFQAIAKDKASPWQPLGAYLAARALVRQATLAVTADRQSDRSDSAHRQPLVTARQELVALAPQQPAAAALLGWVDARLRPRERLVELSRQLATAPVQGKTVNALHDYLRLLDELTPEQRLDAPDAMTRWIALMQVADTQVDPWGGTATTDTAEREALLAHALQIARSAAQDKTRSALPAALWLAPLVTQARPAGAGVKPERVLTDAERQAALAVPPTSPLYQHLRYHLARLQIEQGRGTEVDAEIAALLADPQQPMSTATRNRWRGLKMLSARTLADFLAAAPRQPVEGRDGRGLPLIDADRAASAPAMAASAVATADAAAQVDVDFTRRLYRDLPLPVMKAVLASPALPAAQRTRLTEVLWTRAALLGDWGTADALVPALAAPRATTRGLWERFLHGDSPDAKREAAMLIWVNTPELDPGLLNAQGQRQYWGCGDGFGDPADATHLAPPSFLSRTDTASARQDQQKLLDLPLRNEYLAPNLIEWARKHPSDPEAPKALHFFVASTRNECRGLPTHPRPKDQSATYSRDAFRLLHQMWPKSEWAVATKYHY